MNRLARLRSLSVAACVLAAFAPSALAETITVNSTADRPDANLGDGVCDADLDAAGLQCTLRAALQHANATAGDDTIVVPAGRYRLTIKGGAEDASATGDLDITTNVTILGAGAATTIIDCKKAKDRGFDVRAGATAIITGLTVTGGSAPGAESGGAIRNFGGVTVTDCVLVKCKAGDDAGGFDTQSGGGVLRRVWITKCSSKDDGGGVDVDGGSLTMDASTISKCKAKSEGGGIENSGQLVTLVNCTISGNKGKSNAGGISLEEAGVLAIVHCTIAYNSSKAGGGISLAPDNFGANTCTARSSIIAFNKGGNSDIAVPSQGGNVDSGSTCGFEVSNANPKLARLALNGALLTPTHAIDGTSPASGVATCDTTPTADQRGQPRASVCDSGAFEFSDAD